MVEERSDADAAMWAEAPTRALWARLAFAWALAAVVTLFASAAGAWIGG